MNLTLLTRFVSICLMTLLGFGAGAANRELAYQDEYHRWHVVSVSSLPKMPAVGKGKAVIRRLNGSGITFNIVFEDVQNSRAVGFDDPVQGAARRALVLDVFTYLNAILDEQGSCDVVFLESETAGGGFLASAGTYYNLDYGKFEPGLAFQHITTGVDPYDGYDLRCKFNFGYSYNVSSGPTPGGQYDMFTVLLHEITHGLGMTSSIDSSGNAETIVSGTPIFTTFDNLLYNGNGFKLLDANGTFLVSTSCLTGGDGGIDFHGHIATLVLGQYPPVYTPGGWSDGSSVSHWDTGLNPIPVMNFSLAA